MQTDKINKAFNWYGQLSQSEKDSLCNEYFDLDDFETDNDQIVFIYEKEQNKKTK